MKKENLSPPKTAGVYLLAPEHAPALQILADNPAIAATTRIPHPYPPGGAQEFVEQQVQERLEGRSYVFAIQDRDPVVGVCGLHGIANGEAQELGYWVGEPYWGKGYATFAVNVVLQFAFQNLALTRVGALALESNAASRRVLLKNGFQLLRIEPQRDPLLKRRDELQAVYEITRTHWLTFHHAPALERLPSALQQILHAELAAGNEISESRVGWPEPASVFVKLRHTFRALPVPVPSGVDYTESNSPHWWAADYSTRSPRHVLAC